MIFGGMTDLSKTFPIHTMRLMLRPLKHKDAEDLFNYRSDAITNKFQCWIPGSIEDVYEFIGKVSPEINISGNWFQLAIIHNKSQIFIGDLGLHFLEKTKDQVEIGITIAKAFHGRGFAAEAMTAVINYIFDELNKCKVIGSVDPENMQSVKLLERLGFRKEAHYNKSLLVNGNWVDDVIYAFQKDKIARL